MMSVTGETEKLQQGNMLLKVFEGSEKIIKQKVLF